MRKETKPPASREEAGTEPAARAALSDNWVTFLAFALFFAVCVVVWWMTQRAIQPGAPGAPVG